jgi:DNA-binding transcriptional LysR family regulator
VRVHETIDRALGKRGARRKIALSVPHYLALPYVIEQSDLIATVPREIAQVFQRQAAIRVVNLPLPIPNVALRQHWHRRYHHDAANRWLRERVAQLFAEPEH